jgi:hypothetical protein
VEAGQSQATTKFTRVQVKAEVFTTVETDAEFDTNAAREFLEDRDIQSLSSQKEPAVAHSMDYSCRSYQPAA